MRERRNRSPFDCHCDFATQGGRPEGVSSAANLGTDRSENSTHGPNGKDRAVCWRVGADYFGWRTVTVLRNLSPDQFQQHLRRANDAGRRYIVNFSRREIFGAGTGHHSPIGGYLEAEDLVFVLDVNRDYQPWLIERVRLYAAMDTWDGKKKRGLLLIE